jgi:hypothetical protein
MNLLGSCTYHQRNFEKVGSDTHQYLDLSEQIKIQGTHSIVISDTRKKVHQDQLAVPFTTVSWLLVVGSFVFGPALYNDDGWCAMVLNHCVQIVRVEEGTLL